MLGFVGCVGRLAGREAAQRSITSARHAARCCATGPGGGGGGDVSAKTPTMARARHILVDSEDMIDSITEQLDSGKATFDKLATLVSTCPSKAKGGDLGWFRKDVMVKDFEDAVFKNQPGTIVKLKTEFGWHLIRVEQHGSVSEPMTVSEYDSRNKSGTLEDVQLIDCRETSELESASLPGFLNLPMGEYGRWADDMANDNLGLDKDKETVVMCHHGVRSANFCAFLSQQGFSNVRNLTGGIDAYSKQIDSSVPLY